MFGKINLENFDACKLPQRAQSAWDAVFGGEYVGASFKPLLYLGNQLVKGVNYYYVAEETAVTRKPIRHVVSLVINEFDGEYTLLDDSITEIV